MQNKRAYAGAIEAELKRLQAVADALDTRLGSVQSARHMREDLFLATRDAWAKLEMLRASSAENWQTFRVIVDAAADNLRASVNRVAENMPQRFQR